MSINRRHFLISGAAAAASSILDVQSAFAAVTGLQYAVIDFKTGKELVTQKAHTRRHPASLTKIMALYIVMRAMSDEDLDFNLNTQVLFPRDLTIRGGLAKFEAMDRGHKYKARDLLIGAGSRSDAYSVTCLAIHVSKLLDWGSGTNDSQNKFVDRMNYHANRLGMKDTHFAVITGRPHPNNYSTPADIAKLVAALQRETPNLAEIALGQASFDIHAISGSRTHTSGLLRRNPNNIHFAKTGFTNAAGRCLATYSTVNGRQMVSVVFGAKSESERSSVTWNILKKAAPL
ncbi:MAG TPA: serine hydrolase [Alphaproteobacteria bacterium]